MALFPAVTVAPEGIAVSEKSAKKTANETEAVCPPLVPVTVRFKGFAVVDERPVTVSVLDCPAKTEVGLKLQVAPLLQDSAMVPRNVLGAAAEIVNVAVVEPMRVTFDRALEDSVKTGVPVPVNISDEDVVTAFDATCTLPLTLPEEVGVELTEMVQAWPTFNDAGTVGKFVPQLLVCSKPAEVVMLVMVTA